MCAVGPLTPHGTPWDPSLRRLRVLRALDYLASSLACPPPLSPPLPPLFPVHTPLPPSQSTASSRRRPPLPCALPCLPVAHTSRPSTRTRSCHRVSGPMCQEPWTISPLLSLLSSPLPTFIPSSLPHTPLNPPGTPPSHPMGPLPHASSNPPSHLMGPLTPHGTLPHTPWDPPSTLTLIITLWDPSLTPHGTPPSHPVGPLPHTPQNPTLTPVGPLRLDAHVPREPYHPRCPTLGSLPCSMLSSPPST